MHLESFELMKYFVHKYLNTETKLEILDIGSYDVNGSYKDLFQQPDWKYWGLDMIEGPNVDIVSKSAYEFGLEKQFDVVISGNCLEHVEAPWNWIKEVEKVIKPGGLLCIVTPFSIGEHRYPVDCWRILPDGYKYLLEKESNFEVIESKLNIPIPEIKHKFFSNRPKLQWLIKFIPDKILNILVYKVVGTSDTIAIARKKNE
jgi:SAM-dependent methyltransferase